MKRRIFLGVSFIGALGILVPISFCTSRIGTVEGILSTPDTLSDIFNVDSINEFGNIYLSKYSKLKDKKEVSDALLKRVHLNGTHTNVLRKSLMVQVKNDFEINRVVKLNGWFFSETELHQCALSYLLNK